VTDQERVSQILRSQDAKCPMPKALGNREGDVEQTEQAESAANTRRSRAASSIAEAQQASADLERAGRENAEGNWIA
jgi:hypothetical protein